MKRSTLLTLNLFFALSIASQNVNIPDVNFKSALVSNAGINTNGDGEIQISEASAYSGTISVNSLSIADLTGIEAFTAITALYCYNNLLTTLDISANTALIDLTCSINQLTNLNVSANIDLTDLACDNNQISSLDVSANTALGGLQCSYNQLTSLNVSSNTALGGLYCSNNQLTGLNVSTNTALHFLVCSHNLLMSLDVSSDSALYFFACSNNQLTSLNMKNGNNTNFVDIHYGNFSAINNPNLACIQVDDVAYMNTNWTGAKDATATYSENCSVTGVALLNNDDDIVIYPNPSSGIFTVMLSDSPAKASIIVRNVLGNCLLEKKYRNETSPQIDLSSQSTGVYFIEIVSDGKRNVKKVVLQ